MEKKDDFFNGILALQGELFAYAFSITSSREEAEDAVHNAIIKAYEGLPKLRNHAKLRPWLFRILRNECLQLIRQAKRFAPLNEDIPSETGDEETKMDLGSAVGRLAPELREVLVLYYKLGYSTSEIAAIVNAPRGTVLSRLSRARKRLRTDYEGVNNENN